MARMTPGLNMKVQNTLKGYGGRRRIGPKHESAKRQFAFVFQADTDGTSLRDSCRSRASLCGLCALCVVRRQ